jgi:hypothetical protein
VRLDGGDGKPILPVGTIDAVHWKYCSRFEVSRVCLLLQREVDGAAVPRVWIRGQLPPSVGNLQIVELWEVVMLAMMLGAGVVQGRRQRESCHVFGVLL